MFSFSFLVLFLFATFSSVINRTEQFGEYTLEEIPKLVANSCLLLATSRNTSEILPLLNNLSKVYSQESGVRIGFLKPEKAYFSKTEDFLASTASLSKEKSSSLLFYPKKEIDRKCLLKPPREKLNVESYEGPLEAKIVLQFLNQRCGTFRDIQGSLSNAGHKRDFILENLYIVNEESESKIKNGQNGPVNVGADCERITMPTKNEFIHKYLFRSKPVIITDAMKKWPAMSKWTNKYLINKFGKNKVRVAFAPNSEYEGCEKASDFEDYKNFKLPQEVKENLPFPDLVVVRPAFLDIKFAEFMNLLNRTLEQTVAGENVSAYLEYSSIPTHLPELENDIKEMPFISGILKRQHLNIWLSNGNTLGKLHFDPFDNFLCQVSGKKEVLLYEPYDNTQLYEAHIQEAIIGYESKSMKFRRKKLMDSTSMVMSPVNILKPDYERFPKFRNVKAMNCTIGEGEVLYMPSFWWHEVQSYPNKDKPRNVAVNFWYEPFLTKEYPCDTCKMDVNPFYTYLLR